MQTAMSYVSGTSTVPLLYKTVGRLLDEAAAQWGQRDALVCLHQNLRWSYAELDTAANRLAAALISLDLAPGDRVGIWSPNRAEWVVVQFATAKAGLILVNLNPAYRASELKFAMRKAGCKAIFMARSFKSSDYLDLLLQVAPELAACGPGELHADELPSLRTVILFDDGPGYGTYDYGALLTRAGEKHMRRVEELRDVLQPDDVINIQFTSGTTGLPKGAALTHHQIVNNGFFVARRMQFAPDDRLCIPVPLYHCFGMVMGVLGCVTHGAAMVFPAAGFDPELTLVAVAAERCTALYGVPTMFIGELNHPSFPAHDLSSLRTGIMAGASCPIEVMTRVVSEMHMKEVTIAYGMTETSPVSFQSSTDDSVERRVSTVGTIHPHLEVKIVDNDGRIVPRGCEGELLTRGYSVMQGYWEDGEATRHVIDDARWMHTGDLAVLDDQGYCRIVGRLKDIIIRGGENISPREVEECIYQHPAVRDVSVFGVPDVQYGEEVCAWIRLKPGNAPSVGELQDFCRGQIAHFKVPRYLRFVDDFPMTVTGKIQKFVMREQMAGELAQTRVLLP
ncbi:MAG: AMP-binding protein [Woeseia sp.]